MIAFLKLENLHSETFEGTWNSRQYLMLDFATWTRQLYSFRFHNLVSWNWDIIHLFLHILIEG